MTRVQAACFDLNYDANRLVLDGFLYLLYPKIDLMMYVVCDPEIENLS